MQYSYNNDPRVEQTLADALAGIAGEIAASPLRTRIQAAVLCGGYGRGEGGATPDGRLYNDLDFFVVTSNEKDGALAEFLNGIARHRKNELGIDVDFTLSSPQRLKRNERHLMVQEMLAGHQLIYGDAAALAGLTLYPWNELPVSEGARLLLNRGTGLLLARRQLLEAETDDDFVRRNLHKAALGCGDAKLIAAGNYRQTGGARLAEVEKFSNAALTAAYRTALDYKYAPRPSASEDFPAELERAVALWQNTVKKYPTGFPVEHSPRNLLLNLRYAGKLPRLFPLLAHPRWKLTAKLAELLNRPPHRPNETAYLELWHRFN